MASKQKNVENTVERTEKGSKEAPVMQRLSPDRLLFDADNPRFGGELANATR
jgi:hypothetical protein